MEDLTLLPESEHALSTDGGLLRTVPAEIRRPYGRPDDTGSAFRQAKYHRRLRGWQNEHRNGA